MQEEEVALLSIGAVLEWSVLPIDLASKCAEIPAGFTVGEATLGTYENYWTYTIEFKPDGCSKTKMNCVRFEKDPRPGHRRTMHNTTLVMPDCWYNTVAEAKAACEIHAATGQFPPSVEPEPMEGEQRARGDQRDDQDG